MDKNLQAATQNYSENRIVKLLEACKYFSGIQPRYSEVCICFLQFPEQFFFIALYSGSFRF